MKNQYAVTPAQMREKLAPMYRDAMAVQDACNLSGVVSSFARHMHTLCEMGFDTDQRNRHPVSILFSSKIASLTGSESLTAFSEAYERATEVNEGSQV